MRQTTLYESSKAIPVTASGQDAIPKLRSLPTVVAQFEGQALSLNKCGDDAAASRNHSCRNPNPVFCFFFLTTLMFLLAGGLYDGQWVAVQR